MKILTICPTYNRPELCTKMVKSWHETITGDNALVLGIDIGDPSISAYPKDVNKVICKAGSTVTEVINSIWVKYPDYDFYHITNDDVLYRTKGWDSKMASMLIERGGGIAYGNDLFQGVNLPTFPFISAKVAKAVRYLQEPSLIRYCGDTVWRDIGWKCDCLYYLEGIIIEHCHKLAGKGDYDVDMESFGQDWHSYVKWATTVSNNDVENVKEILCRQ